MLQQHGLTVVGLHIHGNLSDPSALPTIAARAREVAAFAARVGAPFVPLSGRPGPERTEADMQREAAALDEFGRICKDQGVRLVYHNHLWEDEVLDEVQASARTSRRYLAENWGV